jgi:hypothetical protein
MVIDRHAGLAKAGGEAIAESGRRGEDAAPRGALAQREAEGGFTEHLDGGAVAGVALILDERLRAVTAVASAD